MKLRTTFAVFIFGLFGSSAHAQTATYQLDPGATITPYFGATPTGPSEPLSGTFQWAPYAEYPNQFLFLATNIFLDGLTISLRDVVGNYDGYASAIWISGEAHFSATISATGLHDNIAEIQPYAFAPSSFSGSPDAPTHLTFTDLTIGQYGGGYYIAHMQFSATLVPEPASATVMVVGVAALGVWRHIRKPRRTQ